MTDPFFLLFRRRERERKRERTRRAKKNATTTTPMVFLFSGSYNCKARVNSKNEIEGFRNQHRHSKRQSRSIEDRWCCCCCCCWEKGRRGELSEGNRGWSRFFFPQLFSWKKKRGKRFFPFASGTRICKQCRVLKVVESSQYSKWRG